MPPDDPHERQRCPGPPESARPCKNWPWSRQTRYCRNHDPALAEQRKVNGRARTKPPPAPETAHVVEIASWRPEWQRKETRPPAQEHLARVQQILEEHLPERGERLEEALRVLRSIALDVEAPHASRVGAAGRLIEEAQRPAADGDHAPGADMSLEEALRQ